MLSKFKAYCYKHPKLCVIFVIIFIILYVIVTSSELKVVNYSMDSDKITQPIRVVQISDLHSCVYGENQQELIDAVHEQKPDVVMFTGDILDDDIPHENGVIVLTEIAKSYPSYYVSGNHEYWTNEIDIIKQIVADTGVMVLEGESVVLDIHAQQINILGVDDPTYIGNAALQEQLDTAVHGIDGENFSVLLSHRPELVEIYDDYAIELVLSGHAHGGQWRLPGVINGLLAPDQGLFPKYAGGEYTLDNGTTLIVSRGLAREVNIVPRVFNRPELVVIDIL